VPFLSKRFFRNNFLFVDSFNTRMRSSTISKLFVNKTLRVYNGASLKSFFVRDSMCGKKLGEFSITKILGQEVGINKHLKSKTKNKKRK